jgi:hypothetical protein
MYDANTAPLRIEKNIIYLKIQQQFPAFMKPFPHNLRKFRLVFTFLLPLYEKEKVTNVVMSFTKKSLSTKD